MNPKRSIYLSDSREQKIVYVAAVISLILAVLSFGAVAWILLTDPHASYAQGFIASLAAFWVIWPPIWFFYEYFWLYREAAVPDSFELFKHGQQTAVAIWAGISLTLGGLASSDFVKPKESELICTPLIGQDGTTKLFNCHQGSTKSK